MSDKVNGFYVSLDNDYSEEYKECVQKNIH